MGISSKDPNRLNLPRLEMPEICLFPPEPAPELEPVLGAQIMHDLETVGFAFGRSTSPASYKLGVGPTTTANANATSSPAAAAVVDPTNTAEPEPEPEPEPDAVKTETNDRPATHETFNFGFALGGHEDGTSASTTTTTTSSPAMFTLDIGPTTATPAAGAAPLFAAAAPVPSSASSPNGGAEPFKLSFTPPSFETILASVPKKSADTKKRPVRSPRTRHRTACATAHHCTHARAMDL